MHLIARWCKIFHVLIWKQRKGSVFALARLTFTVPASATDLSDADFAKEINSTFQLSLVTSNPLIIDRSTLQIIGKRLLIEQLLK